MRHLIIATAMAGLTSLGISSTASAQALGAAQKKDMSCYVGLSMMARQAKDSDKLNAAAKQSIEAGIFYYSGKIAAHYPGKVVPAVVNEHSKEVSEYIKSTNAKSCMDELKTTLKPAGAKQPAGR